MADDTSAVEAASGYFVDWGKLGTLALIVVLVGVLAITNHIEATTVTTVLGMVTGYTTGNGVQARKRSAPAPVVGHRSILPRIGGRRATDAPGGTAPVAPVVDVTDHPPALDVTEHEHANEDES